jgi:hypothetical protein
VVLPKPAGVFRVICLGDETTLALDLPEEETYCARLQRYLQRRTGLEVEVVNAGLPGGCPLTSLLLLRHRLLGLQPDLVLLHLDASDVVDDRSVRPFLHFDAADAPVAAVHPLCDGRAVSPVTRLAEEFALVDCVRRQLGRVWEQSAHPTDDMAAAPLKHEAAAAGIRPLARLERQALEPIAETRRLLAGAYCELVVTTLEHRFGGALGDGDGLSEGSAGRSATGPGNSQPSRREPFSSEGTLFLDASAAVYASGSMRPHGALLSAVDHDRYAAAQADFVVQRVPYGGTQLRPTVCHRSPAWPALRAARPNSRAATQSRRRARSLPAGVVATVSRNHRLIGCWTSLPPVSAFPASTETTPAAAPD